jgi:hypothetical protein
MAYFPSVTRDTSTRGERRCFHTCYGNLASRRRSCRGCCSCRRTGGCCSAASELTTHVPTITNVPGRYGDSGPRGGYIHMRNTRACMITLCTHQARRAVGTHRSWLRTKRIAAKEEVAQSGLAGQYQREVDEENAQDP